MALSATVKVFLEQSRRRNLLFWLSNWQVDEGMHCSQGEHAVVPGLQGFPARSSQPCGGGLGCITYTDPPKSTSGFAETFLALRTTRGPCNLAPDRALCHQGIEKQKVAWVGAIIICAMITIAIQCAEFWKRRRGDRDKLRDIESVTAAAQS